MSENQTQTVAELNAETDASLAARNVVAPKTARRPNRTAKATAKATATKATKPATAAKRAPKAAPKVRKAATPRERAAKPVTANVAAYVEWLNREIFDGKLTEPQKRAAGIAITLYGKFQISPEREAARSA